MYFDKNVGYVFDLESNIYICQRAESGYKDTRTHLLLFLRVVKEAFLFIRKYHILYKILLSFSEST